MEVIKCICNSMADNKTDKDAKKDAPTDKDAKKDAATDKDAKKDAPTTKDAKKDAPTAKDPKKDAPTTKDAKKDAPTAKDPKKDAPTTKDPKKDAPIPKDEVLVTHVLEKIRTCETVAQLENERQELEGTKAASITNPKDISKADKSIEVKKDVTKQKDQEHKTDTVDKATAQEKGKKVEDSSKTVAAKEKGVAATSPLATFFKDWDKFTNSQKMEIERFIRDKAERMTNFPKVLTATEKKKRWRRRSAYRWWKKRDERREEERGETLPQGRIVKKENINGRSVVTLTLDNSQRPGQSQSNNTIHKGGGDQRYRARYSSDRYSYRRRKSENRRSSRRRRALWRNDRATVDGFVARGRNWSSPWAVSQPNVPVMHRSGHVEQLMRHMAQFMRFVSSIPASAANEFPQPLESRRLPLLPNPPSGYHQSSNRPPIAPMSIVKTEETTRHQPTNDYTAPSQRLAAQRQSSYRPPVPYTIPIRSTGREQRWSDRTRTATGSLPSRFEPFGGSRFLTGSNYTTYKR